MKKPSILVVVYCLLTNHVLLAGEMRRADSVLLNGDWECALGDGTESAQTEGGQETLKWRPATLPGTVATASLKGHSVESSKRVLWVREPKHTVVAKVPAATGEGNMLLVQLDLRRHVLRSTPSYDPVAEQILINLLAD